MNKLFKLGFVTGACFMACSFAMADNDSNKSDANYPKFAQPTFKTTAAVRKSQIRSLWIVSVLGLIS